MKTPIIACSILLTAAACQTPPRISAITLLDNANPNSPKPIAASYPLPTPRNQSNCGCSSTENSGYDNPAFTDTDGLIYCELFRPIGAYRDGAAISDFRIDVTDADGVGCVQIVMSKGRSTGFINASHNDADSIEDIAFGEGVCEGHFHIGDDEPDHPHFKFEFNGDRRKQSPTFSFFRYRVDGPSGTRSSLGYSVLRSWVDVEHYDGAGNKQELSVQLPDGEGGTRISTVVYVAGPRELACTSG